MHIFNAIAGKVPPGTVEAQLVKSAVENTLFIGSYKNDFTEHDKKYPCSMRQDIYSTSLDSRMYRIKENNQKKERVREEVPCTRTDVCQGVLWRYKKIMSGLI